MQSSSQSVTTNNPTPRFVQDRCPPCCPSNSVKALKILLILPLLSASLPQQHTFKSCRVPLMSHKIEPLRMVDAGVVFMFIQCVSL